MILILPGMLRSEFLYSRLLLVYCGEESAGYVVKTGKKRRRAKENRGIFSKNGEKTGETARFQSVSARRVTALPA